MCQVASTAIYHMLARGISYQEFGRNYFDEHDRHRVEKRLIRRLENLGDHVSLEPVAQVA
jgi:hypothetical protein